MTAIETLSAPVNQRIERGQEGVPGVPSLDGFYASL
jgi:hypothetical protein